MTPVHELPKLEPIKWPKTQEERDRIIHERVMLQSLSCEGVIIDQTHTIPSRAGGTAFVYTLWHCPLCQASGYDQAPATHERPGPIPQYTQDLEMALLVWREVVLTWPNRREDLDITGRFAAALGGIGLLACIEVEQVSSLTAEQIALASMKAIGLEMIGDDQERAETLNTGDRVFTTSREIKQANASNNQTST